MYPYGDVHSVLVPRVMIDVSKLRGVGGFVAGLYATSISLYGLISYTAGKCPKPFGVFRYIPAGYLLVAHHLYLTV